MAAQFKLTIHMVSSLDGFIAKTDHSTSWFETSSHYDKGVEAPHPEDFLKTIDCYVMGAKTYELALKLSKDYGWPYGEKPTVVLTHRNLKSDRHNIEFYSGDLIKLVKQHLQPRYKNVWIVGGSSLTRDCIRFKIADEIRVSILPIILGGGLPFFNQIAQEQALQLNDTKAYQNGMVELTYEIVK